MFNFMYTMYATSTIVFSVLLRLILLIFGDDWQSFECMQLQVTESQPVVAVNASGVSVSRARQKG